MPQTTRSGCGLPTGELGKQTSLHRMLGRANLLAPARGCSVKGSILWNSRSRQMFVRASLASSCRPCRNNPPPSMHARPFIFSERGMTSCEVDDRERQVLNQEQTLLFKVADRVGNLNLDGVDKDSVASNGEAPIH